MSLQEAIDVLKDSIEDKRVGLPEEIFRFVSSVTPLVNVDLLIRDENGRTLLSWRDDKDSGTGWHVPGGIVRYHETLEERLQKTALREIGTEVIFDPSPLRITESIFHDRDIRGHYLSFLYHCTLPDGFVLKISDIRVEGALSWFDHSPENLLPMQNNLSLYLNHSENDNLHFI